MLVEFKLKNFLSFKDEQVLSLVASTDKSHLTNIFENGALPNKKLLRSTVIYGANASGKSNLVKALDVARDAVRRSADMNPDATFNVTGFLLNKESAKRPSEFELTFIHEDVRYQYGFIVDQYRVYGEWLFAYPKLAPQLWFERKWIEEKEEYDWHFGSYLKGEKNKLTPLTRDNVLFLSLAAKFNHEQLTMVYSWFTKHLKTVESQDNLGMFELRMLRIIERNPELHSPLNKLLRTADLGIVDFILEKEQIEYEDSIPDSTPENFRKVIQSLNDFIKVQRVEHDFARVNVLMRHNASDDPQSSIPFQFRDESLGTRRLFMVGILLFKALMDGNTLVIDELDTSLHPILVRALVDLFNSPVTNPNNAQLIFNTHDTNLLDSDIFRRDQIWFTEKDNVGASHLYSLLEFSPRKTEAFEKGYLQGKYGAIPIISKF